ncbi:MAG: hypothetical protein JWP91_1629 [Fibrobacteres bacterium]|nr:hypothetical protein [Fibrobacterota bacterium]
MFSPAFYPLLAMAMASSAIGQCIGGKWDTSDIRPRDCTTQDDFDGLYGTGANKAKAVNGTVTIKEGSVDHTLSWRLTYWKSPLTATVKDSLPLILGLHSWQDTEDINVILNSESYIMEYEGAWENALFLTVALENSNNQGTWWWGGKVGNVPTPWAEESIIALLKDRIKDACALLAASGATELAKKSVDVNRVYLRGHSMGGTGTYRMGIKHPEIFAAIHAHAGFADFKGGPCGNENFCLNFSEKMVGTQEEKLSTKGLDGKDYPARDYTDMSWFVGPSHLGASAFNGGRRYDPPYVNMTHGKLDISVDMSAANRLQAAFKAGHYGYSYFRYTGGHSESNFIRLQWLFGFRRNQSYLAFDNNSTDVTGVQDFYNDLENLGWRPGTIVDNTNHYEVDLFGTGTTDITPRRLQAFVVQPGKDYRYWLGSKTGSGTTVKAGADGLLTLAKVKVAGTVKLIIEPVEPIIGVVAIPVKPLGRIKVVDRGTGVELEVSPADGAFRGAARMELWGNDGRLAASSDSMVSGVSGGLLWRFAKPRPGVYRLSVTTAGGRYISSVTIGL